MNRLEVELLIKQCKFEKLPSVYIHDYDGDFPNELFEFINVRLKSDSV